MEHRPIVISPNQIQPDESRLYFFDANVWLQVLLPLQATPDMQAYKDLWDRLAERGEPFIVMNAVLLSEIFNRYLRIRFDTWAQKSEVIQELQQQSKLRYGEKPTYKRHFRPHPDHKEFVEILQSDLQAYEYFIHYPAEQVEGHILPGILANFKSDSDFNDRYYVDYCRAHNVRIVTHDGDFYVGGVEVVTANDKILRLYQGQQKKRK